MNMDLVFLLEILLGLVAIVFTVIAILILLRRNEETAIYESVNSSLFLVRMPQYEKREEKLDIKQAIAGMEQVYASFLYFKDVRGRQSNLRIAMEISSENGKEDISFYISIPNDFVSNIEKSISAVFPGAVIEPVSKDYTIFEPNCHVAASYLNLENDFYYPLNTYQNLNSDPVLSITNALSKIQTEEGAAIQIILRPYDHDIRDSGEKLIVKMQQASNPQTAGIQQNQGASRYLSMLASPNSEPAIGTPEYHQQAFYNLQSYHVDQTTIDAIRSKIKKPVLQANIRLVASATDEERAKAILRDMESSFSQFLSHHNALKSKVVQKRKQKDFIYNFTFRNFDNSQSMVLNLEELSSLYHFPLPTIQAANIKWAKTREVPPPEDLPNKGDLCLGKAIYRGEARPVYFANEDDRRRHFYIVGQTGTGKSTLLYEMIRQDILSGKGVGVIDPHGDLVEKVLSIIPQSRANDVVLFEPADMTRPVGLNMLEWDRPEQKDFAVSEMIMIFSKLFPPEIIGPMFEHYMRNAMLALMSDPDNPGTLVEIPRIFTDKQYMESRLATVSDPLVKSFWLREWSTATGQTRSDMLGYVVSKVGRFVENEMMRNIIGQGKSGFDLAEIMDNGKIFLANLSKGRTGELNSSLLGLILVSKMQVAAMKRGDVAMEKRKDFYLYIDEFHNFTTDNIATILSEARKYRLNLILAHQYMPQLQDPIKNAVLGNAGTIGCFRIGVNDAEFLEKQFEPQFNKYDLMNMENFSFITRMMLNNVVATPFKIKLDYPPSGNDNVVAAIKKISKLRYGRAKDAVEKEISQRWQA